MENVSSEVGRPLILDVRDVPYCILLGALDQDDADISLS